jgi:thioredoxin-like negative regulator of GroEL
MEINLVVIQMASKTLTDQNFDAELVAPGKIVLVIFYDENCSNHYLIEPSLLKLDGQYNQQVKFCRLNTRENPKTAEHFRVFTSPTILFFKNEKLVESLAGTFPRVEVENIIRKLITEKEGDELSPKKLKRRLQL